MGNLTVIEHLTLDGVMQGPGRCDEDTRGDFAYGGWAVAGNDEVMAREMGKGMAQGGALLLGRRTYEDFAAYWPEQRDNPYTDVLNKTTKYVVSTTLREPLGWENSRLISDDVAPEVQALKESEADIGVLGSAQLVETLAEHDLVDGYVLMIHPITLGTGRRLFGASHTKRAFRLTDSVRTTTGVIIATYDRASDVKGDPR